MKKFHLHISILFISSLFLIGTVYSVEYKSPIKNVSWEDKCYYKINWTKFDGTTFTPSIWNEKVCNTSLDFTNIPNWIWALEDGTYTISMKSKDKTETWDIKSYTSETATDYSNKHWITTWWPYKIDTRTPKCVLKSITFKSWYSENQYYNAWNFYYKWNWWAWQFELEIESDDGNNWAWTNVSWLSKIQFPTILWATPTTVSYSPSTWAKVTIKVIYNWSWNNTDVWDMLNNPSRHFCYDEAWNSSMLTTTASTYLKIEDGNHTINWITSLVLTPDNAVPTVAWVAYNAMTNGIKYKTWNTWLWVSSSIYSWNTSTIKFFAALSTRQIELPSFQDNGSWLKTFRVKLERSNNKTLYDLYTRELSDQNTKKTSLSDTNLVHDFRDVDSDINVTTWYRSYDWEIETLNLWGTKILSDSICDMVWNCVSTPTPDFKVVSNEPAIASNTDLLTWTLWTKHNLNDWIYSGRVSNLQSPYETYINFEDTYWNAIVPVAWVKELKLNSTFDNTLWCDQYISPNDWNCIDFTFRNNWSPLVGSSNPAVSEKKVFNYTLNNYSQFVSWSLKIELASAMPTKDEYTTTTWDNLYGSLNPRLQLTSLTLKTDDLTWYNWIWENLAALQIANSATNRPFYKWNPLINFNNIQDIYPLVEWQEKPVLIANLVGDSARLDSYKLETKIWTNNLFLRFRNISLQNWNVTTGENTYDILKNPWFTTSNGYWNINYSDSDTYKFQPKTIWWISSTNTKIALYTILNYKVWTKTVKIPSLQSWFNDYGIHEDIDFTNPTEYSSLSNVTLAEIDIRWISQSRNTAWTAAWVWSVDTSNKFVDFSSIKLYDIKTQINKNVEALLWWYNKNDWIESGWFTVNNLSTFPTNWWINTHNWQVLYFKDTDVTIDCSWTCNVNGKKTIIVENWNIFIKSDMRYNNSSSVLWFILIWNWSSWNKSQFRISEDVTNWVWVVYSEWPIISVTSSNQIIYDGTPLWNTDLVNQLYWKWSFASKNTVWGSIKNGSWYCPYWTPDYEKSSCTLEKAQAYDLIYLRRYARIDQAYYWINSNPMWDAASVTPKKVPINIDKVSVKTAGWDRYAVTTWVKTSWTLPKPADYSTSEKTRNAPLIIEYDSNVQTNPPLWFSNK